MVDTQLLQEKIAQSGLKREYIAKSLGMTPTGLWKKLREGTEFTPSQIKIWCDLLRIDDLDERKQIFLI